MDSWSSGPMFSIIDFPVFPCLTVHEIFNMLLAVFDRAALMLICLFSLSASACSANCCINLPIRQKSCWPSRLSFRCLPCSAPVRVPVEGSLVNVRIIAVMSGGILFGPWVGIITGIIAGTHRYLIDIGGVTAVPALSPALLPGCSRAGLTAKSRKAALACRDYRGMVCETLTMIPVIVWAPTVALGLDIVSKIGIPMILGSVCIGFIVLLVQSVEGEKRPAPRVRPSWRWISPTRRCRFSGTLTPNLYVRFAISSAVIFTPMRSLSPILITCWLTLALVSTIIATATTPSARPPDRRLTTEKSSLKQ